MSKSSSLAGIVVLGLLAFRASAVSERDQWQTSYEFPGGTPQFEVDQLALPPKVERTDTGSGYHYRIEQPAGLRVGAGGPAFKYESLNGDIHIELSKQRNR